jgi:hypothetical protein
MFNFLALLLFSDLERICAENKNENLKFIEIPCFGNRFYLVLFDYLVSTNICNCSHRISKYFVLFFMVQQHSMENQRTVHLHSERNYQKEIERNPNKSKGLLKSLLTRRRSKNADESLYSYLDEY